MADTGDFKGNRLELGHRLPRQRELGPGNFARRFGAARAEVEEIVRRVLPGSPSAEVRATAERVADASAKKKRGPAPRPGPKPWEAEGISRASYFRRKKGGGGG